MLEREVCERIEHRLRRGSLVAVQTHLKDKELEYTLCVLCQKKFACDLTNAVLAISIALEMVLPVWECPDFVPLINLPNEVNDG